MPPRIAADAIIRRSVLDKDNYSSQRCENWNTELHGRSAGRGQAEQSSVPDRVTDSRCEGAGEDGYRAPPQCRIAPTAVARLTATAGGMARTKLPAVSARGSATPRPSSEYTPQAIPAAAISSVRRSANMRQRHPPQPPVAVLENCDRYIEQTCACPHDH
jgi:hypothetical protein